MEPMKGKRASSQVDLGYTELFCISEVTSVFISSCDSVLGDSLVFHQENQGPLQFHLEYVMALHAMQGNRASFPGNGNVSWDFSSCARNMGYILELQWGWPFETPL